MHVAEQAWWNTRVRMYALGFNLMQTMAETKKHQQVLGMAVVANFERISRTPKKTMFQRCWGVGWPDKSVRILFCFLGFESFLKLFVPFLGFGRMRVTIY